MLSDGCPEKHIGGWLVTLDCGAGSTPVGIHSQPVCGRKSKAEGGGDLPGRASVPALGAGGANGRAVCLKRGGSNLTNAEKDCQRGQVEKFASGIG